jgi:hypothetical protein
LRALGRWPDDRCANLLTDINISSQPSPDLTCHAREPLQEHADASWIAPGPNTQSLDVELPKIHSAWPLRIQPDGPTCDSLGMISGRLPGPSRPSLLPCPSDSLRAWHQGCVQWLSAEGPLKESNAREPFLLGVSRSPFHLSLLAVQMRGAEPSEGARWRTSAMPWAIWTCWRGTASTLSEAIAVGHAGVA